MNIDIDLLVEKEGWSIIHDNNGFKKIIAYDKEYPFVHPAAIHLKLYREATNPESRYIHMKAAHDYLWPDTIWHFWTERRFKEHCEHWTTISYAGGASTSKSYDSAKIALIFWLADPKNRAVVIASTSLESIEARIWGYIAKLVDKLAVKMPIRILTSKPAKILYDYNIEGKRTKDTIHGIFAVAAKEGDDDRAISSWIGRHPNSGLMVVLDEATDMPPAILKALPNLESGQDVFQCTAIGNSNSKYDLHGALSTPKDGWDSIDPLKDNKWETTQRNGVCLFFSCYESPAVLETDPIKKKALGKFLITKDLIEQREKEFGKSSDSFYRFVLGFWKSNSSDETVLDLQFANNFKVTHFTEWSGDEKLSIVAGLDPAFSTGGDGCVLRLGVLGLATNGNITLDFRGESLLFKVPILADVNRSAELQIAEYVVRTLNKYNCPISSLCIDANGQGRALGEVIRLVAGSVLPPIKIYSTRAGNIPVKSFDVLIKTNYELWASFKGFIQNNQIKGLDQTSLHQLCTRNVTYKNGKAFLEAKKDYKNRMGSIMPSLARSPDEADASSLVLQSAMLNHGFHPGQKKDIRVQMNYIDEKYLLFNQQEKNKVEASKKVSVLANFSGSLEDYIKLRSSF